MYVHDVNNGGKKKKRKTEMPVLKPLSIK
jgi:hypothetical protein